MRSCATICIATKVIPQPQRLYPSWVASEPPSDALAMPALRRVHIRAVGYASLLGGGDELVLVRLEIGVCRREGGHIAVVRRGDLIAVQLVDLLDRTERGIPVFLRAWRRTERLQAAQPHVERRGDLPF